MLRLLLCMGWALPCLTSQSAALAKAPLVNGLVERLSVAFPGEATSAIEEAIANGLERALGDELVDVHEVSCVRDYSGLCPDGWSDIGDGQTCSAPVTYQGKCSSKQEFGGMTSQQKRQQAARCGVLFPCVGACSADFSASCPFGWSLDSNGDCLAPSAYTGACVGRKNFKSMKQSEKQRWAQACDVSWPCRGNSAGAAAADTIAAGNVDADCIQDFAEACPAGFSVEGDTCKAPASFAGACGSRLPSTYTAEEKSAYADACKTSWPCTAK